MCMWVEVPLTSTQPYNVNMPHLMAVTFELSNLHRHGACVGYSLLGGTFRLILTRSHTQNEVASPERSLGNQVSVDGKSDGCVNAVLRQHSELSPFSR